MVVRLVSLGFGRRVIQLLVVQEAEVSRLRTDALFALLVVVVAEVLEVTYGRKAVLSANPKLFF